jgi:uncharacterized protein YjbK
MENLEFERKRLITKEEYEKRMAELLNVGSATEFIQLNYYYDTAAFDMLKRNETVRVRLKDNGLNLEHKLHKSFVNGTRVCEEKSKPIGELPKSIIIQQYELLLIGCMTTQRTNLMMNNCLVSLDKNYYLGIIDYEIEIEIDSANDFPTPIIEILDKDLSTPGKYTRFVSVLNGVNQSERMSF